MTSSMVPIRKLEHANEQLPTSLQLEQTHDASSAAPLNGNVNMNMDPHASVSRINGSTNTNKNMNSNPLQHSHMQVKGAVPSPVPISLPSTAHHAPAAAPSVAAHAPIQQPQQLRHPGNPSASTRSLGSKHPATRRQSHVQHAHQQPQGHSSAMTLKMKQPHPPHSSNISNNVSSSSSQATSSSTTSSTSKQSKKKKATVTMATAQTATPATTQGENTGRWTAEEHRLFLQGLEEHGKGWKKIASLIKSRTVVQIRTHAQKYFQKLAKARQNGEEGDVNMENRDRGSLSTSSKRRRSGTKRKAISSVVASAEREGKRRAAEKASSAKAKSTDMAATVTEGSTNIETVSHGVVQAEPTYHPTTNTQSYINLPTVAPALAPFVYHTTPHGTSNPTYHPNPHNIPNNHSSNATKSSMRSGISISAPQGGTISGAELEQSLFRFLTPHPNEPMDDGSGHDIQVNDIARQAGANPITVPSSMDKMHSNNFVGGDVSPTGVADINAFPSNWVFQNVEPPTWYTKGADVDELLNEAEALDWLADTGDFNDGYNPPQEDDIHNKHNEAQPQLAYSNQPTSEVPSSHLSEPSLLSLSTENNNQIKIEPTSNENIIHQQERNHHTSTKINNTHQVPSIPEMGPPIVPKTFSNQDMKGISPTPSTLNIPPLPSFFESSGSLKPMKKSNTKPSLNNLSSVSLFASATEAADAVVSGEDFLVDAPFDEQAFVESFLHE